MQNRRTQAAEALSGGLCAFGAALITAPNAVLALAGIPSADGVAPLFVRLVGVRDLAYGAMLLGARTAPGRRRLLRAVAVVCCADVVLLAFARDRLPLRSAMLGATASALAGAQALLASTTEAEPPVGGWPLLVPGYLLTVGPALHLAPIVRQRRVPAFAAFEAGAALCGLGWLRRGGRSGALVNLAAALGGAAWWLWQRRRARPAPACDAP